MKWWGWGEEHISFTHDDKPDLAPFVRKHIGIDFYSGGASMVDLESIDLPATRLSAGLRAELVTAVGEAGVRDDRLDRVVHAYGKSMRDLIRVRRGDVGRPPDVVVYPRNESDVSKVVRAALDADAVLIPFGGGTNIAGSLEPERNEGRAVVSVDMSRLDRVLEIDDSSQLARIQAGALGPSLEEQLRVKGWTIGHFPDSFNHSTLGGWVATRSSGMQSDKYGDIADMTKAVCVVTPSGTLVTRAVPSTSTGPSVREMILGSEGRLGIITEATVQVHRIPKERVILAYLFPTFSAGLAAMRDISESDASPSVTRVSDSFETQFSFATKKKSSRLDQLTSDALKTYLRKRKGFDLAQMSLSFIGYEGSPSHVAYQRKIVSKIVNQHGGVSVGKGPGKLYDQKKFDTPYIRDFLLDRGGLADVSETATSWRQLEPLYDAARDAALKAFGDIGVQGWVMCHMSHSYHSGACLYFTFAFKPTDDNTALAEYDAVKSAVQQSFVDNGGTLSHHHGVGKEHSHWMTEDVSKAGVTMVRALFNGVDPGDNFNPGKIV